MGTETLLYIQICIAINEFCPRNMQEIPASIVKLIAGANFHFAPKVALSAE